MHVRRRLRSGLGRGRSAQKSACARAIALSSSSTWSFAGGQAAGVTARGLPWSERTVSSLTFIFTWSGLSRGLSQGKFWRQPARLRSAGPSRESRETGVGAREDRNGLHRDV